MGKNSENRHSSHAADPQEERGNIRERRADSKASKEKLLILLRGEAYGKKVKITCARKKLNPNLLTFPVASSGRGEETGNQRNRYH